MNKKRPAWDGTGKVFINPKTDQRVAKEMG
jgi:hypothetical protein